MFFVLAGVTNRMTNDYLRVMQFMTTVDCLMLQKKQKIFRDDVHFVTALISLSCSVIQDY